MTQPIEQPAQDALTINPGDIPTQPAAINNDTPITTDGDKLKSGILAEFASFGQQIDALEADAIKPHQFALKQADYALLQVQASDDELLAAFGTDFTADEIRAGLTAEHAPRKAAAEAAIALAREHYDTQRVKLGVVGEDIANGSTDELMALVVTSGVITPGSIRNGLGYWVQMQIQQERDAIALAQTLHTTNIGVFAALGDRLALMSNNEIIEAVDAEIVTL